MEHEEEKREEDNNNDDESEEYTEIDEETDPAVLEERRAKWLEQQLFGDAKRTKLGAYQVAAAFQEDLLQQEQEPKKKRKYRKGPCMLCGTKITPCWRSVGDLKLCNAGAVFAFTAITRWRKKKQARSWNSPKALVAPKASR